MNGNNVKDDKTDISKMDSSAKDPDPDETSNKVETILKSLGGYSTFQKWMTFVLIFPQFATAMIILSPIFTGSSKVPIYCGAGETETNAFSCNVTCQPPPPPTDKGLVYTSIVQEWNLICSQAWVVDMITSFQMAGMTTGALVSSVISDQFGRKKCFLFQTICMFVLGGLPALAFSPWSYAVARFFAGFGVGACFVVYLSHLMEFLTPSWRTICGTISFFPIGEMFLGLLAYYVGSWRWLTFATALPALFLLPFYILVQESPRWLLIHSRTSEAHGVFSAIAKWNGRESNAPSLKEVETLHSEILSEESTSLHGIAGVKAIAKNRRLRVHMSLLILCNLTCSVVYYGVSFNAKNLSGNPYLNVLYMGLFDLVGSPAAIPFNNWVGRRKTFMGFMTLATLFIGGLLGLEFGLFGGGGIKGSDPMLVTILCLLGRFGVVGAWGALTCLILETAPTNLRSSCLGAAAFVGYLGGVLAPQLFLLGSVSASIPYIILCVLTTSSSISSWFIRETLQQPLEDVVDVRIESSNGKLPKKVNLQKS